MWDRGPRRQRLGRRIAVQRIDLNALRVTKAHDRAAAWIVRLLDRAPESLRELLKVAGARNRESQPEKAGFRSSGNPIDAGPRTGSAQAELVLGPRDNDEPEVAKILLYLPKVGALEVNEQQIVRFDDG